MISDAAVEALCEARHPAWSVIQPESRRKLRETARRELEAAAPKIYAHWAEGRVAEIARALDAAADGADLDRVDTFTAVPSATAANAAKRLLGLEDRT